MKGTAVIPARPSILRSPPVGRGNWADGHRGTIGVAVLLIALTACALGRSLFSRELVLSDSERDLALQFIHWRKFGFDELRAGRLALWNPHIYSGAPFFGGFQSALLYPPNWLYLCLPLVVAINVGIALHVFLAGFGMYLWTRQRGLHPLAALLGGVVFMFSGPFFPHMYAGHLPNLCTMAWGPFIFLAIDGWLQRRTAGWLFLGAGSLAMQILAGHPQYVFYTGVAAALYCIGQLAVARVPVRAAAGLAGFVLAGVGLSAVQLFEGFHAAGESVRNHGTSEAFAGLFSFPPENLLTLLIPNFFGSLTDAPQYWGRWLLWEMSLFFSVTGLVLAAYALMRGPRRWAWSCGALVIVLLVLATGAYSPFFFWLYRYAPGFSRFRGWSKFTYPAIVFLVALAATGFDILLRERARGARLGRFVFLVGALALALSCWMSRSGTAPLGIPPQPWQAWIHRLAITDQQFLSGQDAADPRFAGSAARYAGRETRFAAITLLVLGTLVLVGRRYPRALAGVVVLAGVESLCFARSWVDNFPITDVLKAPDAEFLSAHAGGDVRVSDDGNHDLAMSVGARDIWGYDPGVLRRYAEWMTESQDRDPDDANDSMKIDRPLPPAFATLLRACWTLPKDWSPADGAPTLNDDESPANPAARLMLFTRFRVIPERNDELDTIYDARFEPTREVLLESTPVPAPTADTRPGGEVRLVAETTDALTIEAVLPAAAILMITDTYSDGWHARSLLPATAARAQTRYQVLPADYCMRAIPLAPGHHRILLEYQPLAFVVGKWISLLSLAAYLGGLSYWWRSTQNARARREGVVCGEAIDPNN